MSLPMIGVRGERVALCDVSVSAVLRDLLSEVTVSQTYRNDEDVNIEAVYTFPLPLDAVLLDLRVEIGDRVLTGVVVEKTAAEAQYEDAIEAGGAAVMLEEIEPGLYTMNVGNLLPKETATITFSYALVYRWMDDTLRVFLPTTIAPRFGASPHEPHQAPESSLIVENQFSLRVEIFGNLREAQIVCPSHAVTPKTLPDKTVITLKQPKAAMDRDFVLTVKAPQAAHSFVLCGADGEGAAAVASFQPMFPGPRRPRALDLAIVIDCSGSMQGDSIAQARLALDGILKGLQPRDRVTIVAFGSTPKVLSSELLPCSKPNLDLAQRFAASLDSNMGGTEIGQALQAAYAATSASEHPDLFVVTDGEVSSWKAVVAEAKNSGRRVFTVGVGSAVSEAFVRGLAEGTGGACELVSPQEGMADRIIRHFERMRAPRAKSVAIRWPEGAHDLAPSQSGAVFGGDTVTAFAQLGRPSTAGLVVLEIEADSGEVFREQVAMALPVESADQVSTVARLAASARMNELGREAGLKTALRYRLVSSWTNWLVVAERSDDEKALDIPAIRKVPQAMAAGWGGVGSAQVSMMSDCRELLEEASLTESQPEPLLLLLYLIEAEPSRLGPMRAYDLLSEAGLLSEFGGLIERGARLGLNENAIAAMILAVLGDGPLREFLSPVEQDAVASLQAYAHAVRAVLDEVGSRSHGLLQVLERAAELRALDPGLARNREEWLARLAETRELFVRIDEVAQRTSANMAGSRKKARSRRVRSAR